MKFNQLFYILILGSLVSSTVYADPSTQLELQQLKIEVAELKTILNQQQAGKNATKKLDQSAPALKHWQSKSGASVNVYGFIRADVAYQFEGGKNIFNSPHTVALEGSKDKNLTEDRLDSTLTTTRLGLDFSTPVDGDAVKGKIEIDFRGGDNRDSVRLRHVYLSYANWLLGQTTSTFLSTETAPEMLDFNTALGGGTTRNPMLRYSGKLDAANSYLVSLEKGNDENRLPLLAVKLKHDLSNEQGYVTARGLAQEVRIRAEDDKTKFGWGAAVGARYKLSSDTTLNANYSHVSGDNKVLLATSDHPRYVTDDQDIELIDYDAFQIGTTYHWDEKVRSTLGYGMLVYDENKESGNKKLQQGWLNVMYQPMKPLTFGVEYVQGKRQTFDQQKGQDQRIEIMAKYDF